MDTEVVEEKKGTGSIIKRLIPIFDSNIPKEIQAEASKLYSSGLTSAGVISRGLTPEQEKMWLPTVIGVAPNSPDWELRTREYWEDFNERIEYGGKDLECGLDDNGKPLILQEYCTAALAENDNTVIVSADLKDASMADGYILVDVSLQKAKEAQVNGARREADKAYVAILDSDKAENTMRYILIANNKSLNLPIVVITAYDTQGLEVAMRTYRDKNPEKFIKDAKSKNVEYIAAVYLGVEYGFITMIPHTEQYYLGDTQLGELAQAVQYLKSNSSAYATLLGDIEIMQKKTNR